MNRNNFLIRNRGIQPSKSRIGSGIMPIGVTHGKLKKVDNFATHQSIEPMKKGTGFGVPSDNPDLIKKLEKLKLKKPKNISID